MIVVELARIAQDVRELKEQQDSENSDYKTGYISALSTVEGLLALAPAYDLDKLIDDAMKRSLRAAGVSIIL